MKILLAFIRLLAAFLFSGLAATQATAQEEIESTGALGGASGFCIDDDGSTSTWTIGGAAIMDLSELVDTVPSAVLQIGQIRLQGAHWVLSIVDSQLVPATPGRSVSLGVSGDLRTWVTLRIQIETHSEIRIPLDSGKQAMFFKVISSK